MSADPPAAARSCKRSWVSGRVQGVFYRHTTVSKARELALDGYARNLPDGRVEVLACGDADAVDALMHWLWTGSSASRVTDVRVEAVEGQPTSPGSGFVSR
jgi:acylphosphatase